MLQAFLLTLSIMYTPNSEPNMPLHSRPDYSRAGYDITSLTPEELKPLLKVLDAETLRITQKAGTEQAFCGNLLDNKLDGFYACVVCGLPLFSSDHKFNSGTGWPSFFSPFADGHVSTEADNTLDMERTEILCARCNAHLGHVFDDGPKPSGQRYCLNSASLTFYEEGKKLPENSMPVKTETAYFAGGCFWGVEHWFQKGSGVINVESGYMQGNVENPTYKDVCHGTSGHAETAKITFDPKVISFEELLKAFFTMHDPTQVNAQGPDFGTQYRSGVWTISEDQNKITTAYIEKLGASKLYDAPIATQVEPAEIFYPAEEYHQDYIEKTGKTCHVANPWI